MNRHLIFHLFTKRVFIDVCIASNLSCVRINSKHTVRNESWSQRGFDRCESYSRAPRVRVKDEAQ